jgi:uncharacterized hydantoinase/oxoprolinase family protein
MLGGDGEMTSKEVTNQLAERIAARQAELIRRAAARVAARLPQPPVMLITAGAGEFLADAVTEPRRRISLARELGPARSQAAAAFAVATLAAESSDW